MDSMRLKDSKDQEQDEKDKEEGIKMAAGVLQTLSKVIKTLKIYPDTSPIRQKFVTELTGKFTGFLEEYGDLTLKVRQSELLYQGEVVCSYPSKEESMAFKLYGDGIRELTFTEGLDVMEIVDFIDVITGDYAGEGGDDDTVTMLWKKDFKNIRYIVVEEGEEGEKLPKIAEKAISTEKSRETLLRAYIAETVREPRPMALFEPARVEVEIEHIYGKPFSGIFTLTPEEINTVQEELKAEEGMDLVSELFDILFHILRIEREYDSYSEIIKNIEGALKTLALSGDYRHITPILTALKSLSKNETFMLHSNTKDNESPPSPPFEKGGKGGFSGENNFSPAHAQEVEKTIDALGDGEFLKQLTVSLNLGKIDDLDALFSFLTMLNKNAIVPLASMVGTLDRMKVRRLFCDALTILARNDIESLLKKLEDNNWYVVRNIVYILGKIGDPKSVHYLKKIKDHEEPRVRKEMVHAFAEINSDEAKDLLIGFLDDTDRSVRITALKNLATVGYQKAASSILNIISSDRFETKEVSEKMEYYETLGRLGSRDTLPYLKEMLMKRIWLFGKYKAEEQRVYAVLALKKMRTPEAMDILREGISSSDKGVRKICEDALQDIEREKR